MSKRGGFKKAGQASEKNPAQVTVLTKAAKPTADSPARPVPPKLNAPPKKSHGKPEEASSSTDTDAALATLGASSMPRQGRLKPAPAHIAAAAKAAASAKATSATTTNQPTEVSSSATQQPTAGNLQQNSASESSSSAAPELSAATTTTEPAPPAPRKQSLPRVIPPAPKRTTAAPVAPVPEVPAAPSPVPDVILPSTSDSMDVDETTPETSANPKKRKSPDVREDEEQPRETNKKRAVVAPTEYAWKQPISTIDPKTMTLEAIDAEMAVIKDGIRVVKERLAQLTA